MDFDPNGYPLWVQMDSSPPGENTAEMYYNELVMVAQAIEAKFGKCSQSDYIFEQATIAKLHSDMFKGNDYYPI